MIISNLHKFIFYAIPKTGTHAVRNLLRPHLGAQDWEQCGLFEKKSLPFKPLARKGHGHLTVMDIQPYLHPQSWDDMFSFCFVRNPYDRFISTCNFLFEKKMQADSLGTMEKLFKFPGTIPLDTRILFQPQYHFIYSRTMDLEVKHLARYENFDEELNALSIKVGLLPRKMESINVSKGSKQVLSPEIASKVYDRYRLDFELLGYHKEYQPWKRQ